MIVLSVDAFVCKTCLTRIFKSGIKSFAIADVAQLVDNSGTLSKKIYETAAISDKNAHLYYRYYIGTKVGDKYLCVVVKMDNKNAFVLTAYLTDSIKKGEIIWLRK